jgi:hypothetical protein
MSADPTFAVQGLLLGLAFGLIGAHIGWQIGAFFARRALRRRIRATNVRRRQHNHALLDQGRPDECLRMLDVDGDGYTEEEADAGR